MLWPLTMEVFPEPHNNWPASLFFPSQVGGECKLSAESSLRRCRTPDGKICSGRGRCDCGLCVCQATDPGKFYGTQCECHDWVCATHNGKVCNGVYNDPLTHNQMCWSYRRFAWHILWHIVSQNLDWKSVTEYGGSWLKQTIMWYGCWWWARKWCSRSPHSGLTPEGLGKLTLQLMFSSLFCQVLGRIKNLAV